MERKTRKGFDKKELMRDSDLVTCESKRNVMYLVQILVHTAVGFIVVMQQSHTSSKTPHVSKHITLKFILAVT